MKVREVCLATAFDAEAGKDVIQRTELREAALKKIQADECSEPQKVMA